MRRNNRLQRVSAVALASLLSVAGMVGLASSAQAADANIDESQEMSLTIHKFEQTPSLGSSTDGTVQDTTGLDLVPMEGVEFTISKVDSISGDVVDLSDTAGWDLVAPYVEGSEDFDPSSSVLAPLAPEATNVDGEAVFNNLDMGLYWVQETAAGDNNITNAMEPFLITVPFAGPTPGTWIYDVHAYPKNSVTNATKVVDNSDALGLGSNVQWTVTGDIPLLGNNDLDSFVITDTLPVGMVHTSQTVVVRDSDSAVVSGFVSPADYTVVTAGEVSTLTFTPAGLVKLEDVQGGTVEFSLATTVSNIGTGTLVNNAVVNVNNSDVAVSANTTWGAVEITKHVAGDASDVLGGAEFQVFASLNDAEELTNPISVDGVSTFVTDDVTGKVMIDGLYASTGGTPYWVVETKAPLGYLANTTPQEITVVPGSVATPLELEVPNTQTPSGTIPELGSTGLIAAGVIGLLSITAGLGMLGTSRRKTATVTE